MELDGLMRLWLGLMTNYEVRRILIWIKIDHCREIFGFYDFAYGIEFSKEFFCIVFRNIFQLFFY